MKSWTEWRASTFEYARGKSRRQSSFIGFGVSVHHAGLLPKYRLLVETRAESGWRDAICGAGISVAIGVQRAIRTSLFTQLLVRRGQLHSTKR